MSEVEISVSASELVPTGDYANITIGPITAKTTVEVADLDDLKGTTQALQQTIEEIVAEERKTALANLKA